jgi:hypothetical protein
MSSHTTSFCFNPSPLDWLHSVDRYCTFDIQNAREHGLPLAHLFSALPDDLPVLEKKYGVSVLMKNHSQRLAYADEVLSALPSVSRFVYIFEPNIFSFILGVLKYPRLYLKYRRHIHFKALAYTDFLKVLGQSRVTIDYAHPSQTGITIRCFEARSVGVAIVTNNNHIFSNPEFDATLVAHFGLGGDPSRLATDFQRLTLTTPGRSMRSVDQFMGELLDEPASPTTPGTGV